MLLTLTSLKRLPLLVGIIMLLLGISLESNAKSLSHLYVFISFAMPNTLLSQYLDQAEAERVEFVLRGVTPGVTLKDFILKKLAPLLRETKGKANIIIDPRLFERFNISRVPTFVYIVEKSAQCKKPVYLKLSGAVSLDWAEQHLSTEVKRYCHS